MKFVYALDGASQRGKLATPPFAIRKFSQVSLQALFMTLFKCVRTDLEKYMRERLKFNSMTPDEEAFNIHFLRPKERPPLFKLKIVS